MNKLTKLFNRSWIYKMKIKNSVQKFKTNVRDYSYELLFIWNSYDIRYGMIKYITLLVPFVIFIKYVRTELYARHSFEIPVMGLLVHEEMRKYHTDLPRDKTEARNLNKMLYSKEYTLKY